MFQPTMIRLQAETSNQNSPCSMNTARGSKGDSGMFLGLELVQDTSEADCNDSGQEVPGCPQLALLDQ
jgi:hypothetical protein